MGVDKLVRTVDSSGFVRISWEIEYHSQWKWKIPLVSFAVVRTSVVADAQAESPNEVGLGVYAGCDEAAHDG